MPLRFVLSIALTLFVCGSALEAEASITVNPSRIVLGNGEREADLLLYNRSNVPTTYRLSVVTFRMTFDGKFIEIQEKDALRQERIAKQIIRFSPRQVELEPNQAQTVRVMARRPANLPPGEYLTFLRLAEVPTTKPRPRSAEEKGKKKVAMSVTAVYAISIPVIVRQGKGIVETEISNVELKDTSQGTYLSFDIDRHGQHSVYGDLQVRYQAAKTLESVVVGEMNGVSVLLPVTSRRVAIKLSPEEGKTIAKGRFEVIYTDREAAEQRELASAVLTVP